MDPTPQNNASPELVRPQVVPEYMWQAPPPSKPSFLRRLLLTFLIMGFLGSLMLNVLLAMLLGLSGMGSKDLDGRVTEKFLSHQREAKDKVAVLSIEGTILSGEGFFRNQIDHAIADEDLKGLVVRVNSPGGTITGSDYMLHHLQRLAKEKHIPIVVSMGGMAASGGYYVSMCVGDEANTIFAEPTTWTGSIGVIIPHYNISDLMKNWGIQEDAVASHRLKGMGSFARKMTEEERAIFQGLVDDGFTRFKDIIKQGRAKFAQDPEALDKLATGQVYTADQALENGLVDKIGFLEDAVDRVIEMARLDASNVKVVRYKAERHFTDILFGSESRTNGNVDLVNLLNISAPQAYYLCTWLPSLISTQQGNDQYQ